MSQIVQLKRSALSGKVPDTGSLNLGELAVNTYDGKIYFKKSGSIESIESVLTTNSTITGSIRLEGSGSFGSLKVNDTLTVNHGETIISGSALVTSDLTILGAVNARQFNISVISSSVLFQSGSTRFGNTSDDTHDFTGSVQVTGSLYVNGSQVGIAAGPNTYDFNLDPEAAGTVNYIVDSTENTYALAQTGSFDVKIANTTRLSVSASAMWVTTGSVTSNYMHLAKYITNGGDLDFNI
mgnify:FL=1|jgi:hypothetical protein